MVTFLLSAVVLCALIIAGHRVNMYLYSQGAVGTSFRSLRRREPIVLESLPLRVAQKMMKRERDDGLRVARFGLVFILCTAALLTVVGVSAFSSAIH